MNSFPAITGAGIRDERGAAFRPAGAVMREIRMSQNTSAAAERQENSGRETERRRRRNGRVQAWGTAPYMRSRITTGDLMYLVVLALLPCAGVGIYHYGFHAAVLLGVSVLAAIASELVCDLVKGRRPDPAAPGASVMDYSCVVTGLIGGLILPPAAPYWMAAALPVLAIAVVKHLSGGIGKNLFNPAMGAKFVLLLAARETMLNVSTWEYTEASPLVLLAGGETPDLLAEITGRTAGNIGTSSAAAVLASAAVLYLAGMIDPAVPFSAIAAFSACYVLFGRYGLSAYTLGVQLCGGSFLFTVFIMAEDFTTTPVAKRARAVYGALLGVLIFLFRQAGFAEDACVYALLCVNALRPLLDRRLPQAYFGANSKKWVIRETPDRKRAREEREKMENERTNAQVDAEFAAFEEKIERETRGLETARYTGDDTLLREALADVPEGAFRSSGQQRRNGS